MPSIFAILPVLGNETALLFEEIHKKPLFSNRCHQIDVTTVVEMGNLSVSARNPCSDESDKQRSPRFI
ncbi:hypothetical protein LC609_21935 [Nostoc sp. XA013]|nr:hypothetical protein [Nostoc sp. XA013]